MRARQRAATLATIFAIFGALLFGSSAQYLTPAYGHGLSSDESMVATLGDREAVVRVDMTPSFLLAEDPQEATISIRFFDRNADQNIPHVTFFLALKKADKVIMRDWFHTHEGHFLLNVRPTDQQSVMVNAPKEPILNGWIGELGAPALAQGPIFTEGGLHEFDIEVFSIDTDKTLLDPPIRTSAFVSIGETVTFAVTDGSEDELSIRTFYDEIRDFSYDEQNKLVKFSMPLNWDKEYLSQVPLVHEEVVIPRSFSELVADKYTATLNGVRLPGRALMIDASQPDKLVVHYMIPNQQLLQLADHVIAMSADTSTAEFVLVPGTVDIGMPIGEEKGGQAMAMSSKGRYHGMLSLSPSIIEPGTPASFAISLMDASTGGMIDASYEFVIVKDGQEILRRSGNTVGGTAGEQFTFTDSEGSVTLRLENISDTGEDVEFNLTIGAEVPVMPPMEMPGMMEQIDVSVAMKQTKRLTLMAVKNNDDLPIYGLQLKATDGDVRFVKARGWDRERIDQNTVLVSTMDRPLLPGKSQIVLLLGTNPSSSMEWVVLNDNAEMLGKGVTEPRVR